MVRVFFVSGFNRSGTTLVTTAVTEATRATTLTVGHMARHMPSIEAFLADAKASGTTPDRGVDRLLVTESTPEEYGWLLFAQIGSFVFGDKAVETGALQTLVDELAGDGDNPVVVLKNPFDVGREARLLEHFPDARILLVRRRLAAIEDSMTRSFDRLATSPGWVRALMGNSEFGEQMINTIVDPVSRKSMVRDNIRKNRDDVRSLAKAVASLPPERVAFLSYDELRADPRAGAAWAAHLLDPDLLAKAIAADTFPEYNRPAPRSFAAWAADRAWARAWQRARANQLKAGVRTGPAAAQPVASA